MTVTVQQRQCLADLAIQIYGDIRGAMDIALANGLDITAELQAGMELECPDVTYDPYISAYVKNNSIRPATELSEFDEVQARIFTEQFTEEYV